MGICRSESGGRSPGLVLLRLVVVLVGIFGGLVGRAQAQDACGSGSTCWGTRTVYDHLCGGATSSDPGNLTCYNDDYCSRCSNIPDEPCTTNEDCRDPHLGNGTCYVDLCCSYWTGTGTCGASSKIVSCTSTPTTCSWSGYYKQCDIVSTGVCKDDTVPGTFWCCREEDNHSECNSSDQCVSVSGAGVNECSSNSDCEPQPTPTPPPTCNPTAPGAPTNTSPTDGQLFSSSVTDVDLEWSSSGWGNNCNVGTETYSLYIDDDPPASNPDWPSYADRLSYTGFYQVGPLNLTQNVAGLLPGEYWWAVRAFNGALSADGDTTSFSIGNRVRGIVYVGEGTQTGNANCSPDGATSTYADGGIVTLSGGYTDSLNATGNFGIEQRMRSILRFCTYLS